MQVSVVIPSYNHRQYVVEAIESVLDQDWPDIDLIVIDDGSKDGSAEVIGELLDRRGGFRLVARENRGLIRTLNEGISMASGEYFCLLASDDYLPAGSLRSRAEFLVEHPGHVGVFADGLRILEDAEPGERILDERRRQLFSHSDPIPGFLKGLNLPIHTMMAKRDVFLRFGGFDSRYRYCEDLDVQLLLFLEGKVGFVDTPVYCYRLHGANISLTNPQLARADKVLCFRKYLEEVPRLAPYRKLIRHRLRRHYLALGRYLHNSGGGSERERELFQGGWEFAWQDVRLLWYLLWWKLVGSRRTG
ncbi:hypothetical protein DESUT3_22580 [Desulfuromonas versatilis]|uniref:Glycosyltransferase 2-like domain-containing protein n=1 Tax=Desulfuromonas versatilis TaxID=2802975 RepID=A0ABN6DZ21_9BACT|nr:glycosyltransferase [Desulfuromonas versatilis]BCR05189.1 hypothetical protein DESUT3_22580 [Desulfuromonas versatilis]